MSILIYFITEIKDMWKIFLKENTAIEDFFEDLEEIKKKVYIQMEKEVKEYFAKKVIVYFDNFMIFNQKIGFHQNLMSALSLSEKEMLHIDSVFPRVECYWIRDNMNHVLVLFGLPDDKEYILSKKSFNLIEKNAFPKKKIEEIEHIGYKTLFFDVQLVNYAINWIKYIPEIEERSKLQADYILLNMLLNKENPNLNEGLKIKAEIRKQSVYPELYQKILRIMPKIESSLEQEWENGEINKVVSQYQQNKKKNKF